MDNCRRQDSLWGPALDQQRLWVRHHWIDSTHAVPCGSRKWAGSYSVGREPAMRISTNSGLVAIVCGQPPPDGDQVFLLLWTLVQPGITGTVIDVRAHLAAGCGMQIKHHIETFGAAPGAAISAPDDVLTTFVITNNIQVWPNQPEYGGQAALKRQHSWICFALPTC